MTSFLRCGYFFKVIIWQIISSGCMCYSTTSTRNIRVIIFGRYAWQLIFQKKKQFFLVLDGLFLVQVHRTEGADQRQIHEWKLHRKPIKLFNKKLIVDFMHEQWNSNENEYEIIHNERFFTHFFMLWVENILKCFASLQNLSNTFSV